MTAIRLCTTSGWLLAAWLVLSLFNRQTLGEDVGYKVPNPFSELTQVTADEFYFIKAKQEVGKHVETVEEFFSFGLGIVYSLHEDPSGKSEPWALLVDGRNARSYILHNPESIREQEIDCELDHLHSHKHLFPWQYIYDVSKTVNSDSLANVDMPASATSAGQHSEIDDQDSKGRKGRRKRKRRNKATIYGMSAVWLNLIQGDVRSTLVGPQSPYPDANSWKLSSKDLEVEMLFDRTARRLSRDYATAQSSLDKTKPKKLKISTDVRYKDSSVKRQAENIEIEEFASGFKEKDYERLRKFRTQLALCRKANTQHRQFPNLMRALASSSERLYKIDYVTKKYNLYGLGELDGKYHEKHHRFMWPYELTSEVFSLNHDIQTIIYDPSFMASQEQSKNGARMDLFMSRFTENTSGRSERHATAYYHMMVYGDEDTGMSCKEGEREPKPKYRLLSSPFTFHTAKGMQYVCHLHGLGALLLNAAHLHYKSFSLFDLEIQVPIDTVDLDDKRSALVNVWQVFDKHDKVRVLFYIEKRNPTLEPFSWDLSDRDRNDLARLVRVDLREAPANTGDEMSLSIDEAQVDHDEDMLAQFFIFNFEFELEEHEAEVYFEVPDECKHGLPHTADDQDSSDEDEDPFDEMEENYEKPYDDESQGSDDDTDSDLGDDHDWADEYQQQEGLETSHTPLPDFIEMLGDQTTYQFITRLELLNDAGQAKKAIWLKETMDLATERLLLKDYLTHERLISEKPHERFYVAYDTELVFRITQDRRCLRIDDVDRLWFRLFSGHLYYHVAAPTHEHKSSEDLADSDLVIESNSMSSYGIGALWRRASESGLAEYLGTRRERLERDGRRYRQLEWLYDEYDMSIRFTFLLEENKDGSHKKGAEPQLESVVFLNEYGDEFFDDRQGGNFGVVRATVEEIVLDVSSIVLLPLECHDEIAEAQQMIELDHEIKPPTFEDVLGFSGTYEISYRVKGKREDDQSGRGEWNVQESFDRKFNRGKIVIYQDNMELEIYIDGQSKRMFAMSKLAGQCSIITSLGPTFNSMLSSLVFDNEEFDPNRMHGLLGLWQMLSKRHAKVHVKQMYTMLGVKAEEYVYRIEQVKPPEAGRPEVREEIKMFFDKRRQLDHFARNFNHKEKISKRMREQLSFVRIEFRPIKSRMKQERSEMDTSKIIIDRHMDTIYEEWVLPEECKRLLGPGSGDPSTPDVAPGDQPAPETPPIGHFEFPKLSNLFSRTNRFHMRAEVSIKGDLDTLYVVDELYNEGDVRLSTRGIGKRAERNCDLLMFLDTYNQFDLSTPFNCVSLNDNGPNHCLHPSLRDVWLRPERAQIEKLSHLHYGPLTLWKLAEEATKSGAAKLIKTIDISAKRMAGLSLEIYKQEMEREMNREVWQISSKLMPINDYTNDWSYDMEFIKHQRPILLENGSESIDEWHVLESITARECGDQYSVFIDVVNYNYQPNDDESFIELFRLPEGWNCRRRRADDKKIDLGSLESGLELDYEASLELFDVGKELVYEDDELGPLRVKVPEGTAGHMPTLLGAYWTSGDLVSSNDTPPKPNNNKRFDLAVHQSLTRFANGKTLSKRIITDRERRLEYELDTKSGSCRANEVSNSGWTLYFRTENGNETHFVRMSSIDNDLRNPFSQDLFTQLFVEASDQLKQRTKFYLVNKYEVKAADHKALHLTYETELDSATLSSDLVGPARVVRKYERLLGSGGPQLMDFMTAQMYLLSPDKEKLRAILTVRLQVNPPARLSEFLSLASVADCFNRVDPIGRRQLESFTLEYPMMNQFDQHLGRVMAPMLLDEFYANLLHLKGIIGQVIPLQLNGRAHLDFGQHDRLVRVHFEVMEAPSAEVYFHTNLRCTMTDEMAALSESRPFPTEAECSHWCDQVNCLAMSYCSNRLCRVATEVALFGPSANKTKSKSTKKKAPYEGSLKDCTPNDSCLYFYNEPGNSRPPTLSRFRDHLDRIVNNGANQKQLKALSLPLDIKMNDFLVLNERVTPTRFYESEEMFRWQHEDFEDAFAADPDDAISRGLQVAASSFAVWKQASHFDIVKIDKLNEELGGPKFILAWEWASDQASCLEVCQRHNCLLVSWCKEESRCEQVTAMGGESSLSLGALNRILVKPNSPGCTISIRDHLDKFHLFESSQKPDKFWHRLDDYSAPECAAACYENNAECLSFDLCTSMEEAGGKEPEQSVCFLQRDHVSQDSFDRSKLLPSWATASQANNRDTIDNRQVSCDHYSKSVVAEFRRVPNAKLKELHESALQGVSIDKCAADCLQDDTCRAFEHCLNPRRHPTQSCYLIRPEGEEAHWLDSLRAENPSDGTNGTESSKEKLDEHLVLSKYCSIYGPKEVLIQERVDHLLSLEVGDNSHSLIGSILLIFLYLLIAAMVGAVIQFVYIRATGRAALSLRPK